MIARVFRFLMLIFACTSLAVNADDLSSTDAWKDFEKAKQSLPKDASRVLDRAVNCNHLSGEINGDRSQHDKEIIQTTKKLRCGRVERDVQLVKKKYATNGTVQHTFKKYYESE